MKSMAGYCEISNLRFTGYDVGPSQEWVQVTCPSASAKVPMVLSI